MKHTARGLIARKKPISTKTIASLNQAFPDTLSSGAPIHEYLTSISLPLHSFIHKNCKPPEHINRLEHKHADLVGKIQGHVVAVSKDPTTEFHGARFVPTTNSFRIKPCKNHISANDANGMEVIQACQRMVRRIIWQTRRYAIFKKLDSPAQRSSLQRNLPIAEQPDKHAFAKADDLVASVNQERE